MVKKEGTAWSTPSKPAKGKPAPAAGRKPKLTGPKHFLLSQSGEEDNEGGDSGDDQAEGADPVKSGIEGCVLEVERLKALLALMVGHEKHDNPFLLHCTQDLAEQENQLLTLRGAKTNELPFEARRGILTLQIREVKAKTTRSRGLRDEAKAAVIAANDKLLHLQEQLDRQKQKAVQLQAELDEVYDKRPPVYQDSRSEDSSDGGGSDRPSRRGRSPAPRSTPVPPVGAEGTGAPAAGGAGSTAPANGAPASSGGQSPIAASPNTKLAALMVAGIKRRNTGGQSSKAGSKAKGKSPNTGGSSEMSDVPGTRMTKVMLENPKWGNVPTTGKVPAVQPTNPASLHLERLISPGTSPSRKVQRGFSHSSKKGD